MRLATLTMNAMLVSSILAAPVLQGAPRNPEVRLVVSPRREQRHMNAHLHFISLQHDEQTLVRRVRPFPPPIFEVLSTSALEGADTVQTASRLTRVDSEEQRIKAEKSLRRKMALFWTSIFAAPFAGAALIVTPICLTIGCHGQREKKNKEGKKAP